MFVSWRLYRSQARGKLQRERNDARARLKAVLVESVWLDGKPRQKYIAFLGSTSIDGSDWRSFWYGVITTLDRLGNRVSPQDRQRIVAAITRRLGEPPPARSSSSTTVISC